MKSDRAPYMMQALKRAADAAAAGEIPVAALVVERKSGNIIAEAINRTERDHDPTAHAEILAIRAAAAKRGDARLPDCDLYVTLEPCAMCAAAISFARIHTLYYGAYDPKGGGVDHGARFFQQATCHHAPTVFGGIEEQAAKKLLQDFFRNLR